MNFSTIIAFISAITVFGVTVLLSFSNAEALFDAKAVLIVFGGSLSTAFICFPAKHLFTLFKVFLKRVLGGRRIDHQKIVEEIVMVSKASYAGRKSIETILPRLTDPFLKDAAEILTWIESDVSSANLRDMLETRAYTHYRKYMADARIFRTIAKFPPVFGLMGTTIGMIALLQSLAGAKESIGPAMAVALTTTLYGLALANFIFVPISENLEQQTAEDQVARLMVVEGIIRIRDKLPTVFVKEHVNSFLLPTQRAVGKK